MSVPDLRGGGIASAIAMIASTTDMTSLLREVAEAYRLTISMERDIHEIDTHYRHLEQVDSHIHDEIMLALERSYAERAEQVAMIERVVTAWNEREQFELAHSATIKMLELLKASPLDKALETRQVLSQGANMGRLKRPSKGD